MCAYKCEEEMCVCVYCASEYEGARQRGVTRPPAPTGSARPAEPPLPCSQLVIRHVPLWNAAGR
ncbi:hypothetical protein ABH932_004788 [Streptacidiphilus sp. MAP5-52]